ncbi:MAG: hypothetical protein WAM30_13745, partial [Candidatus Dormiibacterota bacterium]
MSDENRPDPPATPREGPGAGDASAAWPPPEPSEPPPAWPPAEPPANQAPPAADDVRSGPDDVRSEGVPETGESTSSGHSWT